MVPSQRFIAPDKSSQTPNRIDGIPPVDVGTVPNFNDVFNLRKCISPGISKSIDNTYRGLGSLIEYFKTSDTLLAGPKRDEVFFRGNIQKTFQTSHRLIHSGRKDVENNGAGFNEIVEACGALNFDLPVPSRARTIFKNSRDTVLY